MFDESRDHLHAYLQRFERVVIGQGCLQDKWVTAVSRCLTGETLTVIGRMTTQESLDYQEVKRALLQRFRFTAKGYQETFRTACAQDEEVRQQVTAWLWGYFDHWVGMAEVLKTHKGSRDHIISEQSTRSPIGSSIFLKERKCKTLGTLAESTDRFLEAHCLSNSETTGDDTPDTSRKFPDLQKRPPVKFFSCDRVEHRVAGSEHAEGHSHGQDKR